MRVKHCPMCGKELVYEADRKSLCNECGFRLNVYDDGGNKGVIILPKEKR